MSKANLLSHRATVLRRAGAESIREVVFGVEDGVVQNATLIAGMVGASLSATVIVVAGVINAAAGVLSMSIGTYLSSKAERDVRLRAPAREGSITDPGPDDGTSPVRAATVMAAAYACGAVVPVLPFLSRTLSTWTALLATICLTLLTLFALGFGKAALSGQSRWRSGLEMLVLASVAGVLGYLIGVVGRAVFDVDF